MSTAVAAAYEFGPFRLDPIRRRLLKDGAPVALRPKEFELLMALVQRPGRDIEKDELMKLVWPDAIVEDNAVPHAISKVRKVLEERPGDHRYVVTVPGLGYRFVTPVRVLHSDSGRDITESPPAAGPAPRTTRLIVLPFRLLRPDPAIEFLTFSLPDAVTSSLSGLEAVVVRSSATAWRFAHETPDVQAIASAARVDLVLTGTILSAGDELRVSTQLMEGRLGTVLWSQTSQVLLGDIFRVQDELVHRIVGSLSVPLTARDHRRLRYYLPSQDVDRDVYTSYLKGRYYLARRTPDSVKRAVACFDAAIERDPRHAPAYAGLADCYVLGGTGQLSRQESMTRAKTAAAQALTLDDGLPEAHASLASVAFRWAWDWAEAEREFRRAIELDPAAAALRHGHALFLAAMGRFPEALAEMHRASDLDPLSLVASVGVGRVLDFSRRYDAAIEQYRATIEMDPGFAESYFDLAMALMHKAAHHEALAAARHAVSLAPESIVYKALVAAASALAGDLPGAETFLRTLEERSDRSYLSPFLRAHVSLTLRRTDEALSWLQRACDERAGEVVYMNIDPDLDSLRSDPRFSSLVRRIGFPA